MCPFSSISWKGSRSERKMDNVFLLLLLALLSGCMVGPDYHPPCYDIPEVYEHEVKNGKDSLNLDWWTQFEDPVLEELIDNALTNNKDVQIAAANILDAIGLL